MGGGLLTPLFLGEHRRPGILAHYSERLYSEDSSKLDQGDSGHMVWGRASLAAASAEAQLPARSLEAHLSRLLGRPVDTATGSRPPAFERCRAAGLATQLLLGALLLGFLGCAGGYEIHVSPGSARFPTLHHARDHLRATGRPAPVRVIVHPGDYPSLSLDPQLDSGRPGARIEYVAASAVNSSITGRTVINAGITLPNRLFQPVGGGSPLVRADLLAYFAQQSPPLSLQSLGGMKTGDSIHDCQHDKTDLIFGGERMVLGRWPNIAADGGWRFINTDVGDSSSTVTVDTAIQPNASRLAAWAGEPDSWIHGYWTFDWTDSYVKVGQIARNGSLIGMRMLTPTPVKRNARFYGVNLLCEVDVPGEYFIHPDNGTLWFYPPVPLSQWAEGSAVLSYNDTALNVSGISHASFRGFEVRNAKSIGVVADGVSDVLFQGIRSINHGTTGVQVSGDRYSLVDSVVSSTGCIGVQATGGETVSLTGGGNLIQNNTVSKNALWKRTYMAGLRWGGHNNTFRDNRLSDGPHNCVLGGGNEFAAVGCLHEGNTIQNCAYEASDTGAWYSCGQSNAWVDRGNVARRNSFRNIQCRIPQTAPRSVEGCGGGVQAVYLDDQMSGWHWEQNTFDQCDTGFFIGGGRDNIAINNTFTNCKKAVHFDNRGMNWEKGQCNCGHGDGNATGAPLLCSYSDVLEVTKGPAGKEWLARWPALTDILNKDHICTPVHNQVVGNRYANCGQFIDASPADVQSWLSNVSGNINMTDSL